MGDVSMFDIYVAVAASAVIMISAWIIGRDKLTREGCKYMYQRLRDLREDRDLNQTEVAKMLGMSQTGYSKYETGENDIPTAILIKLAKFYNTSIDYLLGETDNPKRY